MRITYKSGNATGTIIQGKQIFDFKKLIKTPGFTNEFHDIYDHVIYGRNMREIRFN